MKEFLLFMAFAVALTGVVVKPSQAQEKGPHEAEFKTFYAAFLKAVQANDKEKIADMIAYPVQSWSIETKGMVDEGSIKDKADFLARYNVLFTNFMRMHVVKSKVQPTQDGWFTSWRDANSEFSFDFTYVEGIGFKIASYGIGPY